MLKSMPGTTCAVQNATCSVSAKKLSGLRLRTMRPTGVTGTSSSGTSFVGSSTSKLNLAGLLVGEHLQPEFPGGVLAGLDRLPQVTTVVIGIRAGNLHRFVPAQRMRAEHRIPVELRKH